MATSLHYPEMIPIILTTLVTRHEKRGLTGGNVLNGLQKLLNHNAKAGLLTDKKMSEVLKILLFDVSADQCAKLMKALDPDNNRAAPVEDIIEVFKSELIKIPKAGATAVPANSPPKRRTTHGKVGEAQQSVDDVQVGASVEGPLRPKAERPSSAVPSSSVDKSLRVPPAIGTLQSKSSGNMTSGEIDWSKEPLPEGWERKRLAKNNKIVYVNKTLEEVRWQHPNDPSKPKPKKSSNKEGLSKTADAGVLRRVTPASEKDDVGVEGAIEGAPRGVDVKAKTLPLPKKVEMVPAEEGESGDVEEEEGGGDEEA